MYLSWYKAVDLGLCRNLVLIGLLGMKGQISISQSINQSILFFNVA